MSGYRALRADPADRCSDRARLDLAKRLRARQLEIEEAIFERICSTPMPASENAAYAVGLRDTVAAVLDYSLTSIEHGDESPGPIPPAAVEQAHRAAHSDVGLDIALLRYTVGHRLLVEIIMEEASSGDALQQRSLLRGVLQLQGSLLEHLQMAIAREYKQERVRVVHNARRGDLDIVQKLLAGGSVDTSGFNYVFDDTWHLGVIVVGARAAMTVHELADRLRRYLLQVSCGDGTIWAWLGGERKLTSTDVERELSTDGIGEVSLAIGEPGKGIEGWRLTHQEAQAALMVALRKPQVFTRCADVALEAAVLRDDVMAKLLVDTYLSPLDDLRIGRRVVRETLRAYFDAGHNVNMTAKALGVDRRTVWYRLDKVERRLGSPIKRCHAELAIALRLEELLRPC